MYYGLGNAGQACRFAVVAAGAAGLHPMKEHQILAGFLHQHLEIGDVVALGGQVVELVVVGGEHRSAAKVSGQVLAHGPGDREAIEGGSAPPEVPGNDRWRGEGCWRFRPSPP